MEKKRFILFGFDSYYPVGGMEDAITSFDLEEYNNIEKYKNDYDWFQVFDTETFKIYATEDKNQIPNII